jgi:hypothetical protein
MNPVKQVDFLDLFSSCLRHLFVHFSLSFRPKMLASSHQPERETPRSAHVRQVAERAVFPRPFPCSTTPQPHTYPSCFFKNLLLCTSDVSGIPLMPSHVSTNNRPPHQRTHKKSPEPPPPQPQEMLIETDCKDPVTEITQLDNVPFFCVFQQDV